MTRENNITVPIIDVPEPENALVTYVYDRFKVDESFQPDRSARRLQVRAVVPLISSALPVGVVGVDAPSPLFLAALDGISPDDGNTEIDTVRQDRLSFGVRLEDVGGEVKRQLDEWAAGKGFRGNSQALWTIDGNGALRQLGINGGFSGDLDTRFAGSLTSGALAEVEREAVSRGPTSNEEIWNFLTKVETEESTVTRLGLVVRIKRTPLFADSNGDFVPVQEEPRLFFVSSAAAELNLVLDALHGFDYQISLQSAYVATLKEQADDTQAFVALLLSRPRTLKARTFNEAPPKVPTDLLAAWDYDQRALRLSWTMPIDRLGTIKALQVFKRASINEPFRLLREFNWNDNQVVWARQSGEIPSRNLFRAGRDRGWFYDNDFRPVAGERAIYALAVITTHGISSPLSLQVLVSWKNAQVGVENSLISRSGAPKHYPNLQLEDRTSSREGIALDVLSLKGAGQVSILFDPEHSALLDERGKVIKDFRESIFSFSAIQHQTLKTQSGTLKTERSTGDPQDPDT